MRSFRISVGAFRNAIYNYFKHIRITYHKGCLITFHVLCHETHPGKCLRWIIQSIWNPLKMHFFRVRIPKRLTWKREDSKVTNILYLPRKLAIQITHIKTFNLLTIITYIACHTIYWHYIEYCTIQSQYLRRSTQYIASNCQYPKLTDMVNHDAHIKYYNHMAEIHRFAHVYYA